MGGTLFNNAPKATGQPIRPSTPIPQNVQARYAPQQNYRNTPMSIPAPTASGGGFNLGDIGAILNGLFAAGRQTNQNFPIQPTTNQAPQRQGNAGYIQQPILPSMVNPQSINNAPPAPAPVVNQPRPFTYTPPPPPPPPPPASTAVSEPAPSPLTPVRYDDDGRAYNSKGTELRWDEGGGWREKYSTEKRGGRIYVKKPTDEVDRALRVVRNVAKKDKK